MTDEEREIANGLVVEAMQLRAENDRLQAHVESMINAMKADNERLRAALQEIQKGTWNAGTKETITPHEYARRALEPKP